jgi:hypothetical protein
LQNAGLFCHGYGDPDEPQCPDRTMLGYLDEIELRREGEFLVVQTSVGIDCGMDESAYIYRRRDDRWKRIWESEQDDYTKEKYLSQRLRAVFISPGDYHTGAEKPDHLVVTVGSFPWCSSNRQPVYYRIWRTNTNSGQSELLVEGTEIAYLGKPVHATASPTRVLIEYAVGSIDSGESNRRQVRNYILRDAKLQRVAPFVLGPRDFVDQWLMTPAEEVLNDTPADVRTSMEKWRSKFTASTDFMNPTLHCTQQPELWQVGLGDLQTDQPLGYFLIRWRPPYHFSLVGVSEQPWAHCDEEDPSADEFRTLFPQNDPH